MYDVVVVGAGPSGSRYARSAAENGLDVLVLESGEIGLPLACSGHVSLDIWEFVPETAHERLFENDIYGARFHLEDANGRLDHEDRTENGDRQLEGTASGDSYPFYKDEPVSNAIDRVELDRTLARTAEAAGADVRSGHTVTDVTERTDCVEIRAKGPDGVETATASIVAGADGPRSRVREEVGLPDPGEFLHGVLGFDFEPDHADFVDVHLTVPRFFAWRIPRGEAGVEYGLAVAPGDDAPARFDALLEDYGVDVDERCSGAIPIGPPDRTVGERSFLVGDAAGQTKPFTGGGILYGMRAADIAAREIDPDRPATLDRYESAWREELARDIGLGKFIRAGYSMPKPIQRAGLSLFSGEIGVHMDRPTSLFSRAQLRALLSRE